MALNRNFYRVLAPFAILAASGALYAQESTDREVPVSAGVARGSLVICGGGDLPQSIIDRFVELAGGEQAHIVFIPTAAEEVDPTAIIDEWRTYKFATRTVLHTTDRAQADDEQFVKPLKTATGVWFGGGQQQRIADAYLGTAVERELHEVLKRGGVIGGTSAGAAIQSRVMIAGGNPMPELAIGFDFLPGTIIDQHFTQRERLPRMQAALKKHPALLGVGIDEDTAIVVNENIAEVMGRNGVHFYDAERMLETLTEGDRIDLKKRKVIEAKAD